jgi:hypothetical protein
MKRTSKYVALDVHQATTVASVRVPGGRVIARSILATESCALTEFFAGMRGSIHVAFEEGTQAQWLHDLLVPMVERVIVCDRRGEHRGNKADQVDADKLSLRLLSGDLRAVYHGSTDRAVLRELTRTYSNLVEDSTRVMQRLKSLFRARAIRAAGKLDVLCALRPKAKAAMVAEARRDPAWHVLHSIPFLGPVRVALLLATMKTPWRFRTKRNLWGLRRAGGRLGDERRTRLHRWQASSAATQAAHSWSEQKPQSHPQRHLQEHGHGGHQSARATPGSVSCHGCARHARRHGTPHACAKACSHHPAALEERRTLRFGEAEHTADIALGASRQRCGCVPSPRLQVPRRRCEGQSQAKRSPGQTVTPRHADNPRLPRRTRRSVRPAICRVSDRTMVRVVRPQRFSIVQRTRS